MFSAQHDAVVPFFGPRTLDFPCQPLEVVGDLILAMARNGGLLFPPQFAGGAVPLTLMTIGEVAPGGVGSGLYGMLLFIVVAVFVVINLFIAVVINNLETTRQEQLGRGGEADLVRRLEAMRAEIGSIEAELRRGG